MASLFAAWLLCWWIGDALTSRRYERTEDRSRPKAIESRGAIVATLARRGAGVGALVGASGLVVAWGIGGGFAAAAWQGVCLALWLAPVLVASLAGVAVSGLGARVVEWLAWHLSRKLDRGWSGATSAWPRWEGSAVTSSPWLARDRVEVDRRSTIGHRLASHAGSTQRLDGQSCRRSAGGIQTVHTVLCLAKAECGRSQQSVL